MLEPVYLDSQSAGSEWYINHWCPKTVQVDMTVEHKQTLQQGHPIRNGICQSVLLIRPRVIGLWTKIMLRFSCDSQ